MRDVRYYGSPVLRKKCKEVQEITSHIQKVIADLKECVMEQEAAGLAAPQIGYEERIFVNMYSDQVDRRGYPYLLEEPEVYINLKITRFSKRKITKSEGCVSVPGFRGDVERAYDIDIEYMDEDGNMQTKRNLKRWQAQCIQHELDHLDGILFIDHLSERERAKVEGILLALEKQTKEKMSQSADMSDFM